MLKTNNANQGVPAVNPATKTFRLTDQPLLPIRGDDQNDGYTVFPAHPLKKGRIFNGYASLANWMVNQKTVLVDGYSGVMWEEVKSGLERAFVKKGYSVGFYFCSDYFKPLEEIAKMVRTDLGEEGSVWGKQTELTLVDFFRMDDFNALKINPSKSDVAIVLGTGAGLLSLDLPLVYIDVPKNEIQYRSRAGSVVNLGLAEVKSPAEAYKHFYFVDWVVLNAHKKNILDRIDIIVDGQRERDINWTFFSNLRATVETLAKSVFRVRPWFEKGVWGGQWMKQKLKGLNKDEVNYAWSFELITPENGLVFEHDGYLLEVSFDFLMLLEHRSVLGRHATQFGPYFPIRFDFLDTFSGGDLSIQCHPSKDYIQKNFGEEITQDETYYIMDCEPDAKVYLGFQEDIDANEFRNALEESFTTGNQLEITRYVQQLEASKHDFFLIPNKTVHSAGRDNLVLEISATPYIFTFKMYDWVRLDLNGKPRPINIGHAFKNLDFSRKGSKVQEELIAKPHLIDQGSDWRIIHLPTHKEHFYDVERLEFEDVLEVQKDDRCWVMMLVEGEAIDLSIDDGTKHRFNYAETFVVSAGAKNLQFVNIGRSEAKLIKAYIKG